MKTSLFRFLFTCTLLLIVSQLPAHAAPAVTNVCGVIGADTTWLLISSPYLVCCGGVTVGQAATLTIQPGVTAQFENAATNTLTMSLPLVRR